MRLADAATLFRTLLVFVVAYMIIAKYSALLTVAVIIVMFLLDAIDGKLAKIDKKKSKFGPRLDVAGDRVTEYVFWIVFVVLNLVPLFVLFIIVMRHSFVDAFMASKGTSSKMKTGFARRIYASNLFRGGVGVVKAVTFSYLTLVYLASWPIGIGDALVAVLVIYVLVRGAAEIYESMA
ncbi:MAG: CDP-alcohol phosphatidyltransferase family protein [Candidatus Micrarchaeota archaeon]|nr:CDP-alcohol phosphatidyltransferase family protein [Candidatus Micrarchaeota archaeon]MDE1804202.1 CDP-alcohol phosphatidyltransferase family protein [Candidatus Micrarchaeota archaeon]MDE1846658.1 CDP-alcohol phosphatidyltransferase family protein [Candidatus Micrarchaeota archaeon]